VKKLLGLLLVGTMLLAAAPASADLFSMELDGQGTYTRLGNVEGNLGGQRVTTDMSGFGVGGRAMLEILIIRAVFDYQHLFPGADYIHCGLGVGTTFDSIPIVNPYISATVGLIALDAQARMFPGLAGTDSAVDNALGFQGRAGGGLDFPFLDGWLAIGAGADVGVHYLAGQWGYDFSVNLHFGLRI
jgi:hypothetical protein